MFPQKANRKKHRELECRSTMNRKAEFKGKDVTVHDLEGLQRHLSIFCVLFPAKPFI